MVQRLGYSYHSSTTHSSADGHRSRADAATRRRLDDQSQCGCRLQRPWMLPTGEADGSISVRNWRSYH